MKKLMLTLILASLIATTSLADLQGVLDGITVGGPSSVTVSGDAISDMDDSNWSIHASGGSILTIVRPGPAASDYAFGVYDRVDPSRKVQLFSGSHGAGDQVVLSMLYDGSVRVNFGDTGIDFDGNAFGFYLESSGDVFYSDTRLNDDAFDHMLALPGEGDLIQIGSFSDGPWLPETYALGWDAVSGGSPESYDDFVVMIESVSPIPIIQTTCSLEVSMTACVSVPPSREDDCNGKVISMMLEYTGDGCGASSHSQDPKKVKCSGDLDGTVPVDIFVTSGKNGEKLWGSALELPVGGQVLATAANVDGKNNLDAETTVTIIDNTEGTYQEVKFHTSCSQPLSVGDQFGGVKLISLTTTEGGTVALTSDDSCLTELPGSGGPFFDVEYIYSITNLAADPATNVTVTNSDSLQVQGSPIAIIQPGETVELKAFDSISNEVTHTVEVASDEGCKDEASATITKAPPEPEEECTTKVQAMLLTYIGPPVSGPVTVTIKADKFKDDPVSYSFPLGLASGTPLPDADNGWAIDATGRTTTDKRGKVKQVDELGAKTEISINGVKEVIHTSCSVDFVSGQPAPLDNPKGDPSPNWFVIDFQQK